MVGAAQQQREYIDHTMNTITTTSKTVRAIAQIAATLSANDHPGGLDQKLEICGYVDACLFAVLGAEYSLDPRHLHLADVGPDEREGKTGWVIEVAYDPAETHLLGGDHEVVPEASYMIEGLVPETA